MNLADGIRQRGFRKWYERELLQSHAHMVLAFLCLIAVFAAFELISEGSNRLGNALAIIVCTAIGAWALRRYVKLLTVAEAIANQADCPQCKTYARFVVLEETKHTDKTRQEQHPSHEVVVCCKHCQHVWPIIDWQQT